jgi:hypothetical protein
MREEFGADVVVGERLDVIDATAPGCGSTVYRVHFFGVTFLTEPELRVHDTAQWMNPEGLRRQRHLPSGTEFNRRLVTYAGLAALAAPSAEREGLAARLEDLASRLCEGERGRRSIPVRPDYDDDVLLCDAAAALRARPGEET